ncbi:hypothetical protein L9F63_008327, partial [Diploptera punctata]
MQVIFSSQLEVMEQQAAMDTLLSRAEIPIIDLSHMDCAVTAYILQTAQLRSNSLYSADCA